MKEFASSGWNQDLNLDNLAAEFTLVTTVMLSLSKGGRRSSNSDLPLVSDGLFSVTCYSLPSTPTPISQTEGLLPVKVYLLTGSELGFW